MMEYLLIDELVQNKIINIGLYFGNPVFSDGQLYVALFRVGNREGIHVMVTDGWNNATMDPTKGVLPEGVYTRNVVHRDIFQ